MSNKEKDGIPKIDIRAQGKLPITPSSSSPKTVMYNIESTRQPNDPVSMSSLYTIIEKIGDGGMGVVYLAQDRKLGRYLALKRLNKMGTANPSLKERFLREAKAIAALNHIHIVHIYSLGEDVEGPYIAMEYIPGPVGSQTPMLPPKPYSLADRVLKEGPLNVNDAIDLIIKISRAIEYAHSCGIIHRDLKPSNILLDKQSEPKIVDFGLARIFSEEDLTVPGDKMLSLGYGAPEQEADVSVSDERTDIYGLGALTFFTVTGKNPRYFRENDIPEALRMSVLKALETDAKKRWQAVRDFTDSLLSIRTPTQIHVPTAKTSWRCKWCDTLNPVSLRYCGNCGWDGGEYCPECGAETRIGIPYCGNCGVDAREYDMAVHLLSYLKRQWELKHYEKILQNTDRIKPFRPAGLHGKHIIDQIELLRVDTENAIQKRDFLINSIKQDMSETHYERARSMIEEFRLITGSSDYDKILEDIPNLIRQRDLKRAEEAISRREWGLAADLCKNVLRNVDPQDVIILKTLQNVRHKLYVSKLIHTCTGLLIIFTCYVLSAAPIIKMFSKPSKKLSLFYYPITFMHDKLHLEDPLKTYASFLDADDMFDFLKAGMNNTGIDINNSNISKSKRLLDIRTRFDQEVSVISNTYNVAMVKLPDEYLSELKSLRRSMKEKGDYEGWFAVNNTIAEFETDRSFPEEIFTNQPPSLISIQKNIINKRVDVKMRHNKDMLSAIEKYLQKLKDIQTTVTKEGKLSEAAIINNEIKNIRTSRQYNNLMLEAKTIETKGNPAKTERP